MTDPIQLKRVYDPVEDEDGARILVDGVWPRGVRKADLRLDWWARELAPSTELRKWFGHDPDRWAEFRRGYRDELTQVPEALSKLLDYCRQGPVTLIFAARDREHNQAVALREVLLAEREEDETPSENASPVCYNQSGSQK
ncbi:DUF488 domain-containing protein [Kineobactrum salinum]|uniref:DUF488 domain-containing protein n=1 Tax=Kineobactrum salinum TaxID=2708301 RepID=A0A6C0U9Y0_9GAMM|nr:DUF488 domain-containing protein [Kineobactrum salinum]QIB66534.1 DUF488 domain-containing protein [Kineobactrum salinum]